MSLRLKTDRPTFASRTTFEGLGVESGESEDEGHEPAPASSLDSGSESAPKPSKSALKKAKQVARIERQQQRKAAARASRAQKAAPVAPEHAEQPLAPVQSSSKPAEPTRTEVDVTSAALKPPPATEEVEVPPKAPGPQNGSTALAADPPSNVPSDPVSSVVSTPTFPATYEKRASEPLKSIAEPPKSVEKPPPKQANGDLGGALEKQMDTQDGEQMKKRRNMLTRTLWTFIMIGGFLTLLLMGHAYMVILVMLCQTLVYREVTALFSLKKKDVGDESRGRDPWSKTLNWYFFAITNYFLYGESIIYYFKHVVFADAQLTLFATNHRMISFTLYTIGFMGFVLSLKRGYLKQQFGLFCWVHMTLMLIVVSSHFIVNNILEGMIWFFVPASLVICNDVFAYVWGTTLGRTPLIKLSPKKTVEGFVGAFFSTVLFGIAWGTYFMQYDYMICPVHDLGVSAFSGTAHCDPNPAFVWRDYVIPTPAKVFLTTLLGREVSTIPYAPYQYHLFFMCCFASLVAPFGGFFASGFKRAFDIKDFGHSIPGHGGMTDRMDCQFLMGVFTYVYYSSLIRQHHVSVGSLLQMIVSGLTPAEQLELIADLKRYLEGQGIAVPL
ncbi:hypothetical protein WOLCODRAFT_126648 [Wolfiporia cocos MD-104 SS10]|uniref:Phosphatidate cytidylyltransferase n=1 Tax=Wolfiporia cocos (strain MD-104) TaxID=742152 RepID=A0A2H3JBG7_WOLCO|nr:hypothetical protein WOLCODRAFT_126648 [Wolfiporia cocos MD-104 SS10]